MTNRGHFLPFGGAAAAVLLVCTSAVAFQPRAPAPIMPGSVHSAQPPTTHAAPAVKPAAEKQEAAATPAAEKQAAAATPAEEKTAASGQTTPKMAEAQAKEATGDMHGVKTPMMEMHAAPTADAHAAPTADAHAPSPVPTAVAEHGPSDGPIYPVEVLKALLEGNKRYAASKMATPNCDASRRAEVAQGQHPVAIIVSCSDSRVPPELIFDRGIGDLFVVRTAGEVVDDVALGSIEYAVEHLHTKLILVLGHERCGAVAATLAGGDAPGRIARVVEMILPAVEKAKDREGDKLTNCVNANVKLVAEKIRTTEPIITEQVKDGMVRVVGGFYDLDTGLVSIVYSPDLSL